MELERAISPGGSSATSTASFSRRFQIYNKAPKQPDCSDKRVWSKFLAAYQKGDWLRTEDGGGGLCSKLARKVKVEGGAVIDNQDFFAKFKYLAAPPVPKEKGKARREALLRHGFVGPQIRPSVNRYVRHAKSVFKCDFVSLSIASSDDRRTLIIGSEGTSCAQTIAANTSMCGHALLLDEDEVFVVSDLAEDWRFKHLVPNNPEGHGLRFYASAPILLSASDEEREDNMPVHVGRLTIMRKEPWKEFGDAEAEILLDIARMAQEALENEYLQNLSVLVQRMQRNSMQMATELNKAIDQDQHESGRSEDRKGFIIKEQTMKFPLEMLRKNVGATSVTAIDTASINLNSPRTSTFSYSSSPSSNVNYGFSSSSSVPWLPKSSSADSSVLASTLSPQQDGLSSPQWSESSLPMFDQGVETFTYSGSPSTPNSPTLSPRRSRVQNSSASTSTSNTLDEDYLQGNIPLSPLSIIASVGDPSCIPDVSGTSQCVGVTQFYRALKRKALFTKPQFYNLHNDPDSESDDEEEKDFSKDPSRVNNTLGSLLPAQSRHCAAVPIFSNDRSQASFLLVVVWDYEKSLLPCEKYFCGAVGHIIASVVFRAQASLSDRAQLDFIRSVQHELRTPLNAVLGITDFLRQSFVNDDEKEKLDMTEDGILANLLESIRLSGVTLSTILDDVLDFGAATGVGSNRTRTATRIEEVDLEREVEDVCLDELEHISLTERQDHNMRVGGLRGYSAVPALIVKVSPDVQSRFRTDRAKLRKILSKFICNALRFSDENGAVEVNVQASSRGRRDSLQNFTSDCWVDFTIQDTGIGMSREFLANSLLKPFSKADSFSQGVGLGVTIAANLIAQLGGNFDVQSELSKGTRVRVSLPFGRSAPLRKNGLSRRVSQLAPARPYQVQTAAFYGFDSVGSKVVEALMTERLVKNNVRIVKPDEGPELMILQEGILYAASESHMPFTPATETPADSIPHPSGPRARTLVVTRTAMRTRTPSTLDGQKVWFFRPPFGLSSLETMDEFLQEETPIVLRRVPTPTRTTKDNLNKVRGKRNVEVEEHNNLTSDKEAAANPIPQLPRTLTDAKSSSFDEDGSVTTSAFTGTSAPTTLPTPSSPTGSSGLVELSGPKTMHPDEIVSELETKKLTTGEPFRVLVVEDNPVNMRLITALLAREKYNFVEAKDGLEAVEQYKAFKPAVVLLDISLPNLDGFGACLQMRAHQLRHVPKIIAITALSSNEDKVRGLEECGMDDWRTKPLSIKTLRVDMKSWKRDWEEAWGVEGEPFGEPLPSAVFPATASLSTLQGQA